MPVRSPSISFHATHTNSCRARDRRNTTVSTAPTKLGTPKPRRKLPHKIVQDLHRITPARRYVPLKTCRNNSHRVINPTLSVPKLGGLLLKEHIFYVHMQLHQICRTAPPPRTQNHTNYLLNPSQGGHNNLKPITTATKVYL